MPIYAGRADGRIRPNKLREILRAGKPSFSTHLHSMWPSMVEAAGHAGVFDYIEFSGEYAPFDLFSLDNFCRAVELFDMGAMMKLDQNPRSFLAQRAIGAGFDLVLFADLRTVEDAEECVRVVRPDAPGGGGTHGAADRRFTYMRNAGGAEYVQALNDVVVMVMIEKKEAVDRLDEILAVPGIDMVQWGPGDYSMSTGRYGGWASPEVKAVERTVLAKCLAAGIEPRAEIELPDQAKYYLDLGVRHFSIGTDIFVLFDWMRKNGEELRKIVEG